MVSQPTARPGDVRRWWIALTAVWLVGTALRLVAIFRQELWTDEAFTAWLVGRPIREQLIVTARDVHPPLYYLLVSGFSRLVGSSSEWVLRLPSAVAGSAALALAAKLFADRLRPAVALLASSL